MPVGDIKILSSQAPSWLKSGVSFLLHWTRQCLENNSFLDTLASITIIPTSYWEGSQSPRHYFWPQHNTLLAIVPRRSFGLFEILWIESWTPIIIHLNYSRENLIQFHIRIWMLRRVGDLPKIIQLISVRDGGKLDFQNSLPLYPPKLSRDQAVKAMTKLCGNLRS